MRYCKNTMKITEGLTADKNIYRPHPQRHHFFQIPKYIVNYISVIQAIEQQNLEIFLSFARPSCGRRNIKNS